MKKVQLLAILLGLSMFTACKKDYDCAAVDETGVTTVFKCTNCSTKDKTAYEQSILDKGFVSATCAK